MSTWPDPTTNSTFQYPPLPVGVDGIRVLNIEPGEFQDPLVCTLTSCAFGNKPKYVALSYTWDHAYGDNASLPTSAEVSKSLHQQARYTGEQGRHATESQLSHQFHANRSEVRSKSAIASHNEAPAISLNNQSFHISHNLCLALLHLRSSVIPLTLWVDAICIHQGDVNERNAQVAIMSFIYMRAIKVIGWLGTKSYDQVLGLSHAMSIDWKAGRSQHFAASLLQDGNLRCSLEPDRGTFARIANSSYWTRLWIVQEICIPRDLVLVYGSNIWTYDDFTQWRALQSAKSHQLPHSLLDKQYEALIRMSKARDARYTDVMKLESLIEIFAGNRCSEWKDKVYGLLGLANDISPTSNQDSSVDIIEKYIISLNMQQDNLPEPQRGIGSFKVDYSRSLYDIWVDTVKFVFFRAKILKRDFTSEDGREMQNHVGHLKLAKLFKEHERAIGVARTAGLIQEALGQKVQDEIENLNPLKISPVIRAIGYVSGKIVQLGPEYGLLVGSSRVYQNWVSSWEGYYDTPQDLEILRRRNEDYMAKIIAYGEKGLNRVREIRNPSVIAWRMEHNRPQRSEVEQTSAWDFAASKVSAQSSVPRICLGTDCIIATVPSVANVDDVIVQFWNCSAAVVMRPIFSAAGDMSSSFILIGRADIADHLESYECPGRDLYAEQRLMDVPGSSVKQFRAFGAVFIDLDFYTLQTITASINSRRRT